MKFFLVFLLIFSSATFAKSTRGPKGFVLSIGPSAASSYSSEGDALNGKKLLKADGTLGYNFGAEIPIISSTLTLNILGMYSKREALTQYYDRINSIQSDNQKSYISNSEALFGLRFRPLSLGFFKIFLGGGGLVGNAKLRHDTEDYIKNNGPLPANFKDVEKVKKWGHYFEAGTEIALAKNHAVRFMGQLLNSQTEKFQTLNKKDIKGTYTMWTIQYSFFAEFIK